MSADDDKSCRWCGAEHGPLCPWVKAFELDPQTGAIVRVEFLTPKDYAVENEPETASEGDYPKLKPMMGA